MQNLHEVYIGYFRKGHNWKAVQQTCSLRDANCVYSFTN